MSVADRYRRLAARFTTIVDAVPEDRWASPSPCEGWTAGAVLDHVVSTERDFLDRFGFAPEDLPADAHAAWPVVRDAFQAVLDDDRATTAYDGWFGPTTVERSADQFYAGDLVVHGWDIAHAAGLAELEPIDPAEMRTLRDQMGGIPEEVLRGGGVFGPAVELDEGAGEQDQFLAWTGRDPR